MNQTNTASLNDGTKGAGVGVEKSIYKLIFLISKFTSPDGAVVMSSCNGLVGTGFASHQYQLQPNWFLKTQWIGVWPLHLLLSPSPLTELLLTICPRQTAQLITGVCAHNRHML